PTQPQQLSTFFFDCLGDHLQVHSFPTRRSSDLPEYFKSGCQLGIDDRPCGLMFACTDLNDPDMLFGLQKLGCSLKRTVFATFDVHQKNGFRGKSMSENVVKCINGYEAVMSL